MLPRGDEDTTALRTRVSSSSKVQGFLKVSREFVRR